MPPRGRTYLERQPRLHLLSQHLGDAAVEIRQDLHRQLWLDAPLADQIVERVGQRHPDARARISVSTGAEFKSRTQRQKGTVPAPAVELVKGLCGSGHRER
jgi:hypothetical protein